MEKRKVLEGWRYMIVQEDGAPYALKDSQYIVQTLPVCNWVIQLQRPLIKPFL